MAFDPTQYGATPVAKSSGFDPLAYGATPAPTAVSAPQQAPRITPQVGAGLANFGSQAVAATKQNARTAFQNLQSDIAPMAAGLQGDPNQTKKGLKGALSAVGHATVGTVSDLANLVLSPVTGTLGTAVHNIADATSEAPQVQALAQSKPVSGALDVAGKASAAIHEWAQEHPDAYKHLSDIINVAGIAAGGKAAPGEIATTKADMQSAAGAMKGGVKSVQDMAGAIGKPIDSIRTKAEGALNEAAPGLGSGGQSANEVVAKDWAKPSTINKPSYNKARAVLEKNPDVPHFLAGISDHTMNPYSHIEDGVYATSELADKLRTQAGQMSRDMLRPALQLADYTTPKTSLDEIRQTAITNLEREGDLTAGDRQAAIRHIDGEVAALREKHPDGMSLTAQHDEKITYAKNGGYRAFNSNADNVTAIANRNLGRALADSVDTKAPKEVSVDGFNAGLKKFYAAADYLDALNGKKAPVSLAQQVARGVAKFGGAMVGAQLGGGVVSEFAGYQMGKFIEMAIENMTMPMRAKFLGNLERTNPEAFKQVQAYLDKKMYGDMTMKALPAPSAIITPAPSEEQLMAGRARTYRRSASQAATPTPTPSNTPKSIIPTSSPKKEK